MVTRNVLVWIALFVGAFACVSAPAPREPSKSEEAAAEPVVIVEPSPSASVSADAEASAEAPAHAHDTAAPAATGIPECDSYLALYKRCEEYLKPEIMAGNRRFYHAEEASLVHYAGTPEAATMPMSCKRMLDQLQSDCPEQHRTP